MIKRIYIKNFKALRVIDIDLSSLNIFTGLNGMGKSTLLQALLLLRESSDNLEKGIKLKGDLVDIGEYKDAFCESPTEDEIIQFKITMSDGKTLNFESQYLESKDSETVLDRLNLFNNIDNFSLFGSNTFMYLSANRIIPSDSYLSNKTSINKKQFGVNGQYAPYYYSQNFNHDIPLKSLAFNPEDTVFSLEYQLNSWLGVISPKVQVHTEVSNDLVVLKYSYKTSNLNTSKYKAKNAGFGLTYVFSVLVTILSAKEGDILIIENPESHIHPKGQAELARLLSLSANSGVQILVETHSDHILYGARIAIKERDINNEEVQIYYFDRDDEEHFSKAHLVKIDEHGRMDRESKVYFLEYENHLDKLLG